MIATQTVPPSNPSTVPHRSHGGRRIPAPEKRCTFLTPSGSPCLAGRLRDSAFCVGHDPVWQERRKEFVEARRLLRRSRQPRIVEGLFLLIPILLQDLRDGRISVGLASAVNDILRKLISSLTTPRGQQRHEAPGNGPSVGAVSSVQASGGLVCAEPPGR